jgi:hypothetical protein
MAIAVMLDPRCKMELINFCFPRIYPKPEASTNNIYVLNVLREVNVEALIIHPFCNKCLGNCSFLKWVLLSVLLY